MPLSEYAQEQIAAARKRIVGLSNPVLSDLPPWVREFRPHQIEAVERIIESFNRGVKCVVLDAPTGSGKTLIAETVRRMMGVRGLYICSGKDLQRQFVKDFPYAQLLQGRSNYPTERFASGWPELSCDDCLARPPDNPECKWCGFKSQCPYEHAKANALKAQLAVLNTAYFLTEANGPGRFSGLFDFVVADEADMLESALMNHVSVEIGDRRMSRYGLSAPKKVTVTESWKEWIDETLPILTTHLSRLDPDSQDRKVNKESKYLAGLIAKLGVIRKGLDDSNSPWVYTGRDNYIAFKPSRVDAMGELSFWRHSKRFLLMSATVISSAELLDSLGFSGSMDVVRLQSTFPVENRPVVVLPVANMSRKTAEEDKGKLSEGLVRIATRHPQDKMLVHTVSYALSNTVVEALSGLGRPIYSYQSGEGRDTALNQFVSETRPAILVAPSMERGIDLVGDTCRVVVIVKVPYPYLGDRQVSARLHSKGGQVWYTVQACRSIVQMCGRAVRSAEDYAVTYILDSTFGSQLYNRNRNLFPQWWKDALKWER